MALQNRVDPTGALCADPLRGMFMGNRGGKFHQPAKTLGRARWANRQWIICVTRYKHWHRTVWETGYTELFFFDEPTALAAGHRPCFLCQRNAANAYMKAACTNGPLMSAPVLDRVLDAERRTGYAKRTHAREESALPDAAMFACDDAIYALRGNTPPSLVICRLYGCRPTPERHGECADAAHDRAGAGEWLQPRLASKQRVELRCATLSRPPLQGRVALRSMRGWGRNDRSLEIFHPASRLSFTTRLLLMRRVVRTFFCL